MPTKPSRTKRNSPFDHEPAALQYALNKSGLSQSEFAAQLGKSQSLISEILRGTRNANPRLLIEMARVLNCPVVVLERKRDVA